MDFKHSRTARLKDIWSKALIYVDNKGEVSISIPEEYEVQRRYEQVVYDQIDFLSEIYSPALEEHEKKKEQLNTEIRQKSEELDSLSSEGKDFKRGRKRRLQKGIDSKKKDIDSLDSLIKKTEANETSILNLTFLNSPHFFCFPSEKEMEIENLDRFLDYRLYRKNKRGDWVATQDRNARLNVYLFHRNDSDKHIAKVALSFSEGQPVMKYQAVRSSDDAKDSIDLVYRISEQPRMLHVHYKKPITRKILCDHFGEEFDQGKHEFDITVIENGKEDDRIILRYNKDYRHTSVSKLSVQEFQRSYLLAKTWDQYPEIVGGRGFRSIVDYLSDDRFYDLGRKLDAL